MPSSKRRDRRSKDETDFKYLESSVHWIVLMSKLKKKTNFGDEFMNTNGFTRIKVQGTCVCGY